MAQKKTASKAKDSLTSHLVKKWATNKTHTKANFFDGSKLSEKPVTSVSRQILDFIEPDLIDTVKKFVLKEETLQGTVREQQLNLAVFALLEMARYICPADNNEFLIQALIHLKNNPLVRNVLLGIVQLDTHELVEGFMNLPELGVFVAPNKINRFSYVIPVSPTKLIMAYIGKNPLSGYTDQDLVDFSFATSMQSLWVHESHKDTSLTEIQSKRKENDKKVGDLGMQLENPAAISELAKGIISNLPGIKNNMFLQKPLEVALKLWK